MLNICMHACIGIAGRSEANSLDSVECFGAIECIKSRLVEVDGLCVCVCEHDCIGERERGRERKKRQDASCTRHNT